jgi:hypothetical protein
MSRSEHEMAGLDWLCERGMGGGSEGRKGCRNDVRLSYAP